MWLRYHATASYCNSFSVRAWGFMSVVKSAVLNPEPLKANEGFPFLTAITAADATDFSYLRRETREQSLVDIETCLRGSEPYSDI